MAKKKGKKGNIFWKVFAVWLVLLVIACVVALYFGKKIMNDYDASQKFPYENAKEIAGEIAGGDYRLLFDREELHNSMVIEKDEYIKRIADAVEANGGACDVNRGFSPDAAENPTFIISAGQKKIATVVYQRIEEKSEYGFDRYVFKYLTPFTEGSYGVKALVPDDCDFILDGMIMPEKYRTGETAARPVSKDDIEKTEDETCYFYYVDGLMEEPTFRIVYKDTGLDADVIWDDENNVWTTRKYDTAAEAPSNYKVFVNGIEISADERFVSKEPVPVEDAEIVKAYMEKELTMVSYHVSGLRYRDGAEVVFRDFEGTGFVPEYSEKKEEYYCDAGILPRNMKEDYGVDEEFLFTRAIGYATFMNNDAKREEVILPYVLKDTAPYRDFLEFWVTFSKHNSYWIEEQKVENVTFYGKEVFRATVSFVYWIKGFDHKTDNVKSYPTTVTFWYADVGGTWYIVDYSLGGY